VRKKTAVILAVATTFVASVLIANLQVGGKEIKYPVKADYSVGDAQFQRSMGYLLGPQLLEGNRVVELLNGDQIFPAMLGAIRGAQKTITFETYIYWTGDIAVEFAEALSERARAGVKVHLMLDWLGGKKIEDRLLTMMEEAGVALERYHPLYWYNFWRVNNRTHRKILVVDGRVGFTGGVGIGDEWTGNADSVDHWRDTHFKLEGPAVAQMQAAFMDNWMELRSELLHGKDYFPELEPAGNALAQVFNSTPRGGSDRVRMMYLMSIAAARESIQISNAYLIPDDLAIETFVAAARRGVKIEIIVPGPVTDAKLVNKASRSRWEPLLEAGIEIYEYMPTLFHCKVVVVDRVWTSVGSTNFDDRSFGLNEETNLNVLDAEFARRQIEVFEQDKACSRRVTLEEWRERPITDKLTESFSGLLRSQL
jgi:cardiolipin synthase